jgi:hypothetical protein
MRQIALVIALLAGLGPTPVRGQQIPPPSVDRVRLLQANQAGVAMVWEISRERANTLPHWDLDASPSPLSVEDATRIARTWLSQRNPHVEQFLIQQVGFSRVGTGLPGGGGWFWYYTFFFIARGQPGAPLLFYAVVLPDGSPLEPTPSTAK